MKEFDITRSCEFLFKSFLSLKLVPLQRQKDIEILTDRGKKK